MKLIIDDADIKQIRNIYEYYPVDGVTTNPTILSKTGREPYSVLKEIRELIGSDQLHVQVISQKAEDMLDEAKSIMSKLGSNTFIKVPSTEEGFKAMKLMHKEGMNITATVVYSPMQALMAAKCGARYVAPYVNRIDNLGYDGVQVVTKIQEIFDSYDFETGILGASFKNSNQVIELARAGVEACTCSPDVIRNLVKNPAVDSAVTSFVSDFEKLAGCGITMKNCR